MENKQVYIVLDYETFSTHDLKQTGAYEYSMHPSTEILCLAWRVGTRDTLAVAPTRLEIPVDWEGRALDTAFIRHMTNPNVKIVAHNVFFEQCITANVLSRYHNLLGVEQVKSIPVSRWICTAAMSRAVGLPGSLDGVANALELKNRKSSDGHRVMLKLAKPRKPTKHNPATRHTDASDLQILYDYCRADLAAEVELFLRLPELNAKEREFWELDQTINMRGFAVDRELVTGALKLIDREKIRLDKKVHAITKGELNSARQRDKMGDYLYRLGVHVPNLQAATIKEFLESPKTKGNARTLLEIREAISRSSTAKYAAFEIRSRTDGRARDNTQFYGAHTGRQTATGLQPHNLMKPVIPKADVKPGQLLMQLADAEAIEALYAKPMDLYASAIRGAIVAAPGYTLDVGDFATIEVRVLFWLAEHHEGLKALADGRDLYLEMAARIYKKDYRKIAEAMAMGDEDAMQMRQLGKQVVLGAGFGIGIGGSKFQASCKSYGIDISLSLAQNAVRAYRELHAPVPTFWKTIELAAIKALKNPGKKYKHGALIWDYDGTWLSVRLPIGRSIRYYSPRMVREETLYGPREVLSYLTVDNVTRRYVRETTWGGKLTENVTQGMARDVLMDAQLRIEQTTRTRPVLAVHDEAIGERRLTGDAEADSRAHRQFLQAMGAVPAWAAGLPIKVEGWTETRYRK